MSDLETTLRGAWEALTSAAPDARSPLALPPWERRPMSRIALYAELDAVRDQWRRIRAMVRTDDVARYASARWTVKDHIAHVASWATEFRREIETVLRGDSFDYSIPYAMSAIGPHEWNEVAVKARDARTVDDVFDELDRETARLQDILVEIADEDLYRPAAFPLAPTGDPSSPWTGPIAAILAGKCHHDYHHIAQLRARLKSWR